MHSLVDNDGIGHMHFVALNIMIFAITRRCIHYILCVCDLIWKQYNYILLNDVDTLSTNDCYMAPMMADQL